MRQSDFTQLLSRILTACLEALLPFKYDSKDVMIELGYLNLALGRIDNALPIFKKVLDGDNQSLGSFLGKRGG